MSEETNIAGHHHSKPHAVKPCQTLASDSLPFIDMAAGVGLDLLQNYALHPNLTSAIRQIFADIDAELTGKVQAEELCSHCKTDFKNNPVGYENCLLTCQPGLEEDRAK